MRLLNCFESGVVVGGGESMNKQIADACHGQPNSANVTVTVESSANVGGAFGKVLGSAEAGDKLSVTVNCGDFREAQSAAQNTKKS